MNIKNKSKKEVKSRYSSALSSGHSLNALLIHLIIVIPQADANDLGSLLEYIYIYIGQFLPCMMLLSPTCGPWECPTSDY